MNLKLKKMKWEIKANSRDHLRAFSLIEVVIALAMLALIAVPAIGLATMVASRNQEIMSTGDASELKRRIDTVIRAHPNIFTGNLPDSFLASQDLNYIEDSLGTISVLNDQFYSVTLSTPKDYAFDALTDSYRMVVYEVNWIPEGSKDPAELFFASVFRE